MKGRGLLKLVRPHNCLFAGVGVLIGAMIGVGGMPPASTALAFLTAFLVTGGGNAVNDYADRELDAVNNPDRPIPAGQISPRAALLTGQILFAGGVASAIFLWRIPCLAIAIINSGLLAYYASTLKRRGLIGNLTISYLVGSTFLFGSLAVGEFETVGILAAMAGLSTAGRELIKDIEDIRGDRESGSESFPLKYGRGKAAVLAIVLTGAAISLSPIPYILGIFGDIYIMTVTASIAAFGVGMTVIGRRQGEEDAGRASLAYKIGMGLGLIAFLTGSIL